MFGSSDPGPLHDHIPDPAAELRAADAQRPMEYRNATDRMGASVSVRTVAVASAIAVVILIKRSLLTA